MNYFIGELLLEDRPKRGHEEEALQRDVVEFLRWALPFDAVYFAVPNGGKRHIKIAQRLVPQGVRAGVPDLCIVHAGRALFVELKTPTGALSASQRQMHARLHVAGAAVHVCRSVPQVEAVLRELGVPLQARVAT